MNKTHRPIPSILLIGAQKCGTESLLKTMQNIPKIHAIKRELHYFDRCAMTKSSHSYKKSLTQFWNISLCSKQKFVQRLKNTLHPKVRKNASYLDSIYIFEKTPVNVLMPHIAEIVVNEFVQYGTKIFVLFRNPTKRIISGLFQSFFGVGALEKDKNKTTKEVNAEIIQIICQWTAWTAPFEFESHCSANDRITEKMNALNIQMSELYKLHKNESFYGDLIGTLNAIYCDIFYWILNEFASKKHWNWIRGHYALQTMAWLHRMCKLKNRKHSFKIIQSEQLFASKGSFENVLLFLQCFVHSVDVFSDDEYTQFMKQCVQSKKDKKFVQFRVNSMRQKYEFSLDPILQNMLNESYKSSIKWLKLLIDELWPDIVLNGKWKWELWE